MKEIHLESENPSANTFLKVFHHTMKKFTVETKIPALTTVLPRTR